MTKAESAHCLHTESSVQRSDSLISDIGTTVLRTHAHHHPQSMYGVSFVPDCGFTEFEALFYSEGKKGKTVNPLRIGGVGSWVWCPSNSIR
jgi:hypothetical protein